MDWCPIAVSCVCVYAYILWRRETAEHTTAHSFGGLVYINNRPQYLLGGMGIWLLGILFQGVMTFLLFFVVIIAIAGFLARATTRGANRMLGIFTGVSQEIRYAIILFPVFILKRSSI